MKFLLLAGKHSEKGPDGKPVKYTRGDVVESRHDLAAKFNQPPHSIKFQPITEGMQVVTPVINPAGVIVPTGPAVLSPGSAPANAAVKTLPDVNVLYAMSVKELQDWAANEEIDLKGETKKDNILRTIKAAISM